MLPYLEINIHSEAQLDCIRLIKPENRILHLDATGNLVKARKTGDSYGQILNYCFYLKNSSDLDEGGLPICEVATSRHDTLTIMDMCQLLANNYYKISQTSIFFRLIVIDYSWTEIHATLRGFNDESVIQYMHRVYDVSIGAKELDCSLSWLASCASSTMIRFTSRLRTRKIFNDKAAFEFGSLSFSLLLNTIDLKSSLVLFRYLCVLFLSEECCDEQEAALDFIQDAIASRSTNTREFKSIVRNNLDADDEDDGQEDRLRTSVASIKSQSPFYHEFRAVFRSVYISMSHNSSGELNPYFNPSFIFFVLDNFMPFIFIWGSYTLADMGFNRITNRTVDNYWQAVIDSQTMKLNPDEFFISRAEKIQAQFNISSYYTDYNRPKAEL